MNSCFKEKKIRSRKTLDAARDQRCTMKIPGVCNGDISTTVAAHSMEPMHGKSAGQKAHDLFVVDACSACHDVYDKRDHRWKEIGMIALTDIFHRALAKTLRRRVEQGIISIKGMK